MEKKKTNSTKEYLLQVHRIDSRINNMIAEQERLQDMVTRVTQAGHGDVFSGGGRSSDRLGDLIARIVDLSEEINNEVDRFIDKRNEVCAALNKLTNTRYYDVLYKRYILRKKWRIIAAELEPPLEDVRSVYKIHGKALQSLGKILKNR